jgi:hypothetical protein
MTLEECAEAARPMLEWPDDWDGEGSPAPTEANLERALDWARNLRREVERHGGTLRFSSIGPGAGRAVQVTISLPAHRLVVSVPADPEERVLYYGYEAGAPGRGDELEGSEIRPLARWVVERL